MYWAFITIVQFACLLCFYVPCRHGLGRTDYYILYDSQLCFREIIRRHNSGEPLITQSERRKLMEKFFKEELEKEDKRKQLAKEQKKKQEELQKSPNKTEEKVSEMQENEAKDTVESNTDAANNTEKGSESKDESPVSSTDKEQDASKSEDPRKEFTTESEEAMDAEESDKIVADVDNNSENNELPKDATSEENSEAKRSEEESMETDLNRKEDDVTKKESAEVESVDPEIQTEVKMEEKMEIGDDALVKKMDEVDDASVVKKEEPSDEDKEDKPLAEPKSEERDDDIKKEIISLSTKQENGDRDEIKPDIKDDNETKLEKDYTNEVESSVVKTDDKNEIDAANENIDIAEEQEAVQLNTKSDDDKSEPKDDSEDEIVHLEVPRKENALMSLQQMDEAMAKLGAANIDSLASSEPTVAQLLAQSAANPIKWPKERAIQNRVEHIMYAVEKSRWPVDKYFLTNDSENRDPLIQHHQQMQHQQQQIHQQHQLHENERQQRAAESAEVERAHIQALLHPNLHHTLGLNKSALSASSLRSFLESEGRDKLSASDTNALRQLQALQGSLDLTIRPVNNNPMGDSLAPPPRRGPGRPRLDDPLRAAEKRLAEQLQHLHPQEKKRRKLDEIVMGLSSKSKSPETITTLPKDSNPLSLLRGSSVSLLSSRDKNILTNAISSPRLSTSISILQNLDSKRLDSKSDEHSTPTKTDSSSRLVKQSDLPPGINLPPGIELYRPNESKVDKWLEQHQGLLGESTPTKESAIVSSSSASKRRRLEDWSNQLTGEEHVPLIYTKTGQKVWY